MSFNKRYVFHTDDITNEVIQPQLFVCDRQLKKIGEIYPVNDLRINVNENEADEISFSVSKNINNFNNKDLSLYDSISDGICKQYDNLQDYTVVLAKGFGYFEVSPNKSDTNVSIKTLSGNSLGESELSQILCTLSVNTNEEIENFIKLHPTETFKTTVFYDEADEKHSLLHRILSYSPTYKIGHVDDTLKLLIRTFSWTDNDITSIFSDISQEIKCIFDIEIKRDENGNPVRLVNVYDCQYCKKCKSRKIINYTCEKCGSHDIGGIGEDTSIVLDTSVNSDEITIEPENTMKNCFIVKGGDDVMTDVISGIQPSGNNKLYMFSKETKNNFSAKLRTKYDAYIKDVDEVSAAYSKLLEYEYDIFDLILYLQSGRMPGMKNTDIGLHEEFTRVKDLFQSYFPSGLGITDKNDITTKNGVVKQVLSILLDDGYGLKLENGKYENSTWIGTLIIYQLSNNENNIKIIVRENNSLVVYSDDGSTEVSNFSIHFYEDYDTYLRQMVLMTTNKLKIIDNQKYNIPKDWQKYSLNELYSYWNGYAECIQILIELRNKTTLKGLKSKADEMIPKYQKEQDVINNYMIKLEDMVYYLYSYYGNLDSSSSSAPSSLDINYNEYTPKVFNLAGECFSNMVHYIKYGTFSGGNEKESTDHPIYCKNCNSTYVTLDGCIQCKSKDVETYGGIAKRISDSYAYNSKNLEQQRHDISKNLNLRDYLGEDLFVELNSFIREDVYENQNFISDGLGNAELIRNANELLNKAKKELFVACTPQHKISGNVHAFLAFSSLKDVDFPISQSYEKFKIGNYLRYVSDDTVYKIRLTNESFSWGENGCSLDVVFSDVVNYSSGGFKNLSSIVDQLNSLSTSFNTVATQSNKGVEANDRFSKIAEEGLYSALGNVLSARNQDVQYGDTGICVRKYDYEIDDFDPHQLKIINRNIVMTDDNWKTAKLAIGMGNYKGAELYGVWADLLCGNLIAGNQLVISNEGTNVTINGEGIEILGGRLFIKKEDGCSVEINPLGEEYEQSSGYVFRIANKDNETLVGVNKDGEAKFSGNVTAKSGKIGQYNISTDGYSLSATNSNIDLNIGYASSSEFGISIGHKDINLKSEMIPAGFSNSYTETENGTTDISVGTGKISMYNDQTDQESTYTPSSIEMSNIITLDSSTNNYKAEFNIPGLNTNWIDLYRTEESDITSYVQNIESFKIFRYGCVVCVQGLLKNQAATATFLNIAKLKDSNYNPSYNVVFSPNSFSGGGQSGILDTDGKLYISSSVQGDIYFNFSYMLDVN